MDVMMLELPIMSGTRSGDVLQMEYNLKTTFEDLDTFLRTQLPHWRFSVFLGETGPCLLASLSSKLLCDILTPFFALPVFPKVDRYTVPEGKMLFCVETMANGSYDVFADRTDKIGAIKMVVEQLCGVDLERMRVVCDGRPLHDDSTVAQCGLVSRDVLQVCPRLKGGSLGLDSFRFVDVCNNGARRDVPWSKTAPKWRRASRGCVVEGICRNRECQAHGRRVIWNLGMGVFQLENIGVKCPMCKSCVIKENLGFNRCFYKMRGVKSGSLVEFATPWHRVGDWYRTWDRRVAGMSEWNRIRIVVRGLNRAKSMENEVKREVPIATECAICFDDMQVAEQVKVLQCSHSFHQSCWKSWKDKVESKEQMLTCPLCREHIDEEDD